MGPIPRFGPGDGGDHRRVPEFLPGMDVAQMHLNHRQPDGGDGIPDGIAVVGVGARVENHPVVNPHGGVEAVDDPPSLLD